MHRLPSNQSDEYGPAGVEESVIRRLVMIGVMLALLLFACRLQESEDGAGDPAAVVEENRRLDTR